MLYYSPSCAVFSDCSCASLRLMKEFGLVFSQIVILGDVPSCWLIQNELTAFFSFLGTVLRRGDHAHVGSCSAFDGCPEFVDQSKVNASILLQIWDWQSVCFLSWLLVTVNIDLKGFPILGEPKFSPGVEKNDNEDWAHPPPPTRLACLSHALFAFLKNFMQNDSKTLAHVHVLSTRHPVWAADMAWAPTSPQAVYKERSFPYRP